VAKPDTGTNLVAASALIDTGLKLVTKAVAYGIKLEAKKYEATYGGSQEVDNGGNQLMEGGSIVLLRLVSEKKGKKGDDFPNGDEFIGKVEADDKIANRTNIARAMRNNPLVNTNGHKVTMATFLELAKADTKRKSQSFETRTTTVKSQTVLSTNEASRTIVTNKVEIAETEKKYQTRIEEIGVQRLELTSYYYPGLKAKNLSWHIPFTTWDKTKSLLMVELTGPNGFERNKYHAPFKIEPDNFRWNKKEKWVHLEKPIKSEPFDALDGLLSVRINFAVAESGDLKKTLEQVAEWAKDLDVKSFVKSEDK
jgi:hypothetical protein